MIEWLRSRKQPVISISVQEQTKPRKSKQDREELSESEDSDGNEEFLLIPEKKIPMNKCRGSVSAEAFGSYHKKGSYIPKVIPKTEEQKERIVKRLGQAFMFSALDEKEKGIVINAMEEKKFRFS